MLSVSRLNDAGRFTRWFRVVVQVLFLSVIWFVSDRGVAVLGLPISGGIVGLGVLVLLLLTGIIRPAWVEDGAELILANMLLYFIPLVVSVVQYSDMFEAEGFKLLFTIGVGFLSVMLITAFVVEWSCQKIRRRHYFKITEFRRNRTLVVG